RARTNTGRRNPSPPTRRIACTWTSASLYPSRWRLAPYSSLRGRREGGGGWSAEGAGGPQHGPRARGRVVLPTRHGGSGCSVTVIDEQVEPLDACSNVDHINCTFVTTSNATYYLADADMSTLLIDHSFTTNVGISRSGLSLPGSLL